MVPTIRTLCVCSRFSRGNEVHATFFLIGRYVQQRPEIAREVVKAGHVVGNHTFTHPLLTLRSASEIRREFSNCRAALHDSVGEHSNLFRPPFGGRRPAVLHIAHELGLEPVMWNVTGYDWNAPPAAQIERKVAKQIRGGDVILLHDGGHKHMGADRSQTVFATDFLIERYKAEGYKFVTIPEMMEGRVGSAALPAHPRLKIELRYVARITHETLVSAFHFNCALLRCGHGPAQSPVLHDRQSQFGEVFLRARRQDRHPRTGLVFSRRQRTGLGRPQS